MKKQEYSFKTGLGKTWKNMLITWGPAILAALGTLQLNAPKEYAPVVAIVVSAISYMIKNYVENK